MGTLIIGNILSGMVLGYFFKWPVLVPAFGAAIALILANNIHDELGILGLLLQIAVVVTSLQVGYVIGLFARILHHAPKQAKGQGVNSSGETAPASIKPPKTGKMPA